MTKEEEQASWDALHAHYAPIVLSLVHRLRGFYIKIGQVCATRPDIIPPAYVDAFRTLQDGVPPRDAAYARVLVREQLGKSVEELFAFFNDTPIGAATIGQCHEARLHDGREVVVKLQYPEVEKLFDVDFKTLIQFATLAQPEQAPILEGMRRAFMTEFDFENEAAKLQTCGDNIRRRGWGGQVVVPEPIEGMVASKVFVMTKLHGMKLVDGLKLELSDMAARENKTLAQFEAEMKQKYEEGNLHFAAPKPWVVDMYSYGVRLRDTIMNTAIFLYNHSVALFLTAWRHPYQHTRIPINPARMMNVLLQVFGEQILLDGVFNGDPHPGNILLLNDGRLGLIDFGQVQELTPQQRVELSRILIHLDDNNRLRLPYEITGNDSNAPILHTTLPPNDQRRLAVEATEARIRKQVVRLGFRTQHMNPYVIEKQTQIGFNRDDRVMTEGENLQVFLEKLAEIDKIQSDLSDYIMVARTAVLLRGLGVWLGVEHQTAKHWRSLGEQLLREQKAPLLVE